MRVAFDSRPWKDPRDVGQYARSLLRALHETAGEQDEIHESHRARGADVFHAPWLQGAMLHSPCPMVVTIHDLSVLKRPSERLRCGGMHLRLRHLALQRAMQVIVPSEIVADEVAELGLERERIVVIPQPSEPALGAAQRPELNVAHAADTAHAAGAADTAGAASAMAQQPEVATASAWCWQDTARQTWGAYRRALDQPHRPYVIGRRPRISRRRGGRSQPGWS